MFTLTFDCEASGNSSSRSPFANRYSEMPSTVVTLAGGVASAAVAAVG